MVSGFLITAIVKRQLTDGSFSFTSFYFRRAKRLLPAAYVTFAITLAVAPLFLTTTGLVDLSKQLAGAVTFTANMVLWRQTGYFDEAAALKPLLHVWSLSIEEQYYLLLPAFLVMSPRRFWLPVFVVATTVSLVLCLLMVPGRPAAAFYLLPTRGWELGLGTIGALLPLTARRFFTNRWLVWAAVGVIVLTPVMTSTSPHPGSGALLIGLSTLVVLLAEDKDLNGNAITHFLAKVGTISYSLYLVHWPLFAFANNAYVTPIPVTVRWALAGGSISLGYLLYRFVERPLRTSNARPTAATVTAALAASLMMALGAYLVSNFAASPTPQEDALRSNVGMHHTCAAASDFRPTALCQTSSSPRTLLWGDSFAMHLAEGIRTTSSSGLVQATKEVCGPILGIAPYSRTGQYNRKWADDCISFNASVLKFLQRTAEIDLVVLSSAFTQYVGEGEWGALFQITDNRSFDTIPPGTQLDVTVGSMHATIDAIRALGKRVVIVAPPPRGNFDVGRCLERTMGNKVVAGAPDSLCRITTETYQTQNAQVRSLLARISVEANIQVIYFDKLLCDDRFCQTRLDGIPLYVDGGHLTYDGSRAIARHVKLGELLQATAK